MNKTRADTFVRMRDRRDNLSVLIANSLKTTRFATNRQPHRSSLRSQSATDSSVAHYLWQKERIEPFCAGQYIDVHCKSIRRLLQVLSTMMRADLLDDKRACRWISRSRLDRFLSLPPRMSSARQVSLIDIVSS